MHDSLLRKYHWVTSAFRMNWHLSLNSTVHLMSRKSLSIAWNQAPGCQLIFAYEDSQRNRLWARICSHAEKSSKPSQSGFVSQQDLCYKSDYLHNEAGKKGKVELIFFMDLNPSLWYIPFLPYLICFDCKLFRAFCNFSVSTTRPADESLKDYHCSAHL